MSIKDNIKEELLTLIEIEEDLLMKRLATMDNNSSISEFHQVHCEELFIDKLKKFAESI